MFGVDHGHTISGVQYGQNRIGGVEYILFSISRFCYCVVVLGLPSLAGARTEKTYQAFLSNSDSLGKIGFQKCADD